MDDVVAIKVRNAKRGWVGLVTWGRLWDPVDEAELLRAVGHHLSGFGILEPQETHLCKSLREVQSGEYFYEALIDFSWNRPPFGEQYEAWKGQKRRDIEEGRDIYFVGALQP